MRVGESAELILTIIGMTYEVYLLDRTMSQSQIAKHLNFKSEY